METTAAQMLSEYGLTPAEGGLLAILGAMILAALFAQESRLSVFVALGAVIALLIGAVG